MQSVLLQMDPPLHLAATVAYALASALAVFGVLGNRLKARNAVAMVAIAGLALHSASLVVRWVGSGHGPYVSKYELLSAYAWASVALFLVWSVRSVAARSLAPLVFPVALALMGVALYTGSEVKMLPPTFTGVWLVLHVSFYITAFATGVMAASASVGLIMKRAPGALPALPDGTELDRIAHRQAGLAFAYWGIGLTTGAVWAYYSWGRFWGWDPVETWSLVTWLAFGIYLHLRRFHGWKGTRAAVLLIVCFALAIISLFGISLLTSTLHSGYFA